MVPKLFEKQSGRPDLNRQPLDPQECFRRAAACRNASWPRSTQCPGELTRAAGSRCERNALPFALPSRDMPKPIGLAGRRRGWCPATRSPPPRGSPPPGAAHQPRSAPVTPSHNQQADAPPARFHPADKLASRVRPTPSRAQHSRLSAEPPRPGSHPERPGMTARQKSPPVLQ